MPPKRNPLKLNKLQLKTLTLLQELAELPDHSRPGDNGGVVITALPRAHGDHFHLGEAIVLARDATGLSNESVWRALARKALCDADFPQHMELMPAGRDYETGLRDKIIHRNHD